MKRYIRNILIALDQLGGAILLGDPDETISSRLGKLERDGKANVFTRALCRFFDLFDKGHCAKSIEADEGKGAIA